jgi:hypothetical protein
MGLKNSCNLPEFARIQGVLESEIRRIDKNEGGGELSYDELKKTLDRCGFPMVDNDFEILWRRVDKDCLGQVITNTPHVIHDTHIHTQIYTFSHVHICTPAQTVWYRDMMWSFALLATDTDDTNFTGKFHRCNQIVKGT